ncbi:MAG TPA: hypothetical protein H9703_05545 [Candidatus Faecalibacterium faecigallinarum]|uniref:Uncharacterized protein n=1 Tax=Candidatus Faecalibacterium faecigallinarum TaxID=2838577 RepID=A0A9D2T4R6_9FIRM|nr:hypothetical protein [Candidatus Faecalibacterium faecigallinarum]
MKMKKLLALVLSAIIAVSMLTACGGGGGSIHTVSVDRGMIEDMFAMEGYDVDVVTSNELTTIAKQVAKQVEERDYSTGMVSFVSQEVSYRLPQGSQGWCYFIPQAQIEADSALVDALAASAVWQVHMTVKGDRYAVAVIDVTTADGIPCYLTIAIAQ